MSDTPGRLLRLLSLLQSRREWPGAELAERLGVTGRTVRRDIDRLRGLGYPVEGTTGTAGGYRLASGRDLPPLTLDDEEAVAVAAGLLTAAGGGVAGIEETAVRALAKLTQVLPERLRGRIAAVAEATVPARGRPGPAADPATLAVLAAARRDREVVSFRYRARDGAGSERRVEPHALVTGRGRWYLVAYDAGRGDWRTFRVDRIAGLVPTGRRFAARELPAADLGAYVAGRLAGAPYRHVALATVRASAEVVERRLWAPLPGRVEPLDDETCRVRLGSDSLDVIVQNLVALGADFTLDDPSPDLLAELRTVAARLNQHG